MRIQEDFPKIPKGGKAIERKKGRDTLKGQGAVLKGREEAVILETSPRIKPPMFLSELLATE